MSARSALRTATADHHQRVDLIFSRFDMKQPEGYRRFLSAMSRAFHPVEAALDRAGAETVVADWPERRRRRYLERDLAAVGEAPSPAEPADPFNGAAAILGGIYVLEGSRLGGELLRRGLPANAPQSFLAAPSPPGAWRSLSELIEARLAQPEALASAVAAARRTFVLFEAAGLDVLEREVA